MEKNLQLATECWFYAIVYGPLKKYYEYVSKRKSDTHTYLPSSESQSMSSPSSIVPRKSYRHTRASSRSLDLFTAEIDTTGAGAEVTTFEDLMIDPALLETKQRKQPKRRILPLKRPQVEETSTVGDRTPGLSTRSYFAKMNEDKVKSGKGSFSPKGCDRKIPLKI